MSVLDPFLERLSFTRSEYARCYSFADWLAFRERVHLMRLFSPDDLSAISQYRPSLAEIDNPFRLNELVLLSNVLPGPVIVFQDGRGFGLFADRVYKHLPGHSIVDGDLVTMYDGHVLNDADECFGDYIMENPHKKLFVDGKAGFALGNRGRWINDAGPDSNVRCKADWNIRVRCVCLIQKGQEFLLNYGEFYQRNY